MINKFFDFGFVFKVNGKFDFLPAGGFDGDLGEAGHSDIDGGDLIDGDGFFAAKTKKGFVGEMSWVDSDFIAKI